LVWRSRHSQRGLWSWPAWGAFGFGGELEIHFEV
jgi:hypothetical protein